MKQAASKVDWSQRNALYRQVYKSLPSFTASTSYQLVVPDTDSKTWPALASTAPQPPPRVKMPPSVNYVRPTRPEDWEPYRGVIEELYKTQKLKDVMDTMERVYFFKAT